MYKVKLSTIKNTNYILRQTKGGKGISHCGKYKFYVDEDIAAPDFLVMRNKYIKKPVSYNVAPENTVVMISEPKSVVNYPQRYLDQFTLFHSCQPEAKHRNIVYGPAALPWYIGKVSPDGNHPITYDILKNSALPQKTKLISVITSNKAFTKGHQARIDFVAKLKERYGDIIDVYGRGFNEFKDKWDVLAPYKYHITIENSVSKDYWTEKISDCYLTGTLPIYHGCSNITEYFPEDGLIKIDINNFDAAAAIIDKVIENDIYDSRIAALQRCKDLVLDEYNLFTMIAKCCDRLNPDAPKKTVTIKPSKTAFDPYNFYLYFIERNYYIFKGWLKSITGKNSKLKQK